MLSRWGESLTGYICQDTCGRRWGNKPSVLERTGDQERGLRAGDKTSKRRKQTAGAGPGSGILEGHSLESPKMTTSNLLCSSC